MAKIKLAVFDVAGTTAKDDGLVVQAFQDAISAGGYSGIQIEEMTKYVNATMGQRKIDVFLHLSVGNETKAQAMHEDFIDDVSVAASEVPYGRPAPDMVLRSMELYSEKCGEVLSPLDVAVIGDTPSDMGSGQFAHAAFVIGVTSGNSSQDELFSAGATQVLPFATQLLDVVNYINALRQCWL